jgi:hypothetical protein
MTQVVLFPDAEQLVCDWLPAQLTANSRTAPVVTRVPSPRPAEFVRVLRAGGPQLNRVQDQPTLVIEAWAARESLAASLAELARGLLKSLEGQRVGGVMVYRVAEVGGPVNLPDPDSAQARYVLTLSMLLRGTAQ